MGPRAAHQHLQKHFGDLRALTPGPAQLLVPDLDGHPCVLTRRRAHWLHVSVGCWPLDEHDLVRVRHVGPRTLPSFPSTIHVEHVGPLRGWACVGMAVPVFAGQIPWSLVYATVRRLCVHADELDPQDALQAASVPVIDERSAEGIMQALADLEDRWQHDTEAAAGDLVRAFALGRHATGELLDALTPALALEDCPPERAAGHLGGLPPLPVGVPWPQADGIPLPFLGVIGLDGRPRVHGDDDLPTDGYLLFFAGERAGQEIACRVLHIDALGVPQPGTLAYRARPVLLAARVSVPAHWAALPATTLALDDDQEAEELVAEALEECADLLGPHLLGCAPRSGAQVRDALLDPRWAVLAQFPSDPITGMHFGDAGVLTVAVPREDLRARRFDRAVARYSD